MNNWEWDIYKRYSNFVDLHEHIKPYFKSIGLAPPKLPPKIENKETTKRN